MLKTEVTIENPDYHFNDFVNTYYERTDEVSFGEVFRVLVYEYTGGFTGDYDQWIERSKFYK